MAIGNIDNPRGVMPAQAEARTATTDASQLFGADEQRQILALVQAEKGAQDAQPRAMRSTAASTQTPGVPDMPIVARYMIVPPDIVARYMVVPPWVSLDAHTAIINEATSKGVVNVELARLIRKVFNRDVMEARKEGRDISQEVASYLKSALGDLKMDDTAKDLLFGPGSPGHNEPIYYILPPAGGPIYYILPPPDVPRDSDQKVGPNVGQQVIDPKAVGSGTFELPEPGK